MTDSAPFPHLHVHSDYTLSRGASKVKDLVKKAAYLGMPALALTDDTAMYGAMEFSDKAAEAGVQPVIGVKLWMDCGMSAGEKPEKIRGSFILIAQNEGGYASICSILAATFEPREGQSSDIMTVPFDAFETADLSGVLLLTGGTDGFLKRMIEKGRKSEAAEVLDWLRSMFDDRIYLEVCRFGDETKEEVDVEKIMIDMAYNAPEIESRDGKRRSGVPLVATTEVWYTEPKRHDAYEILKAVDAKKQLTVDQDGVVTKSTRRYHMRSAEEMRALFSDIPEAYENACLIPMRLRFMVGGRKPILPPFATEGGRSEVEELRAQSWEGLEEKLTMYGIEGEKRKVYEDRLEFELGIIERMGFPGYFLIVSDFIKWAKAHDIPVGPGRGSGAGSLVAYSLKITNLDPLRFGLLFERFLNPDRVSMPDFDVDFCQDRREEVIQYVVEKYGRDQVSLIATFGVIKSKTAISDMGRIMITEEHGGYGFSELKRLTSVVPMEGAEPMALEKAYKDEAGREFRQVIDSDPKYRMLFDNAVKVEGLYRNHGSHAAGVVIGDQPLHRLVPVGRDDSKGMPVSQYNMKYSEAAGLVKFDFLGLKTLSVIKEALTHIRNTTGEDINLDLIPLDDPGTYEMLSKGFSNGVFQLESEGMKKVLTNIKPTRIEDLIAVVALYRPGPMDMIPHYADCKNGKDTPNYPEPIEKTKPFLEETFGIMVYQEQVMLVAQNVAGYSLGGADLLRRAMGKKKPEEMAAQRAKFIEGAVANGGDAKKAEELFDLIDKFAGYGFNKSHAAAYALISYHTAWLKHNYPSQFMAALFTYEDKPEKMAKIKEDMEVIGMPMLPPCMNKSFPRFTPEKMENGKMAIRFGLGAIKGISGDMGEFLEERHRNGTFKTIEEFWGRCGRMFGKGQLQPLTEAGAFDSMSNNRASTWSVISYLLKGGRKAVANQNDLFGNSLEIQVPHDVKAVPEWGNKADRQFTAVGFYFGEHPLDAYLPKLALVQVKRKRSLYTWMSENKVQSLTMKRLAGMVEIVEKKVSRNTGNPFVYAKISEKADSFSMTIWDDVDEAFEKLNNALIGRRPIVVAANVVLQEEREDLKVTGKEIYDADELVGDIRGNLSITVSREEVYPTPEEMAITRRALEEFRAGKITKTQLEEAELKTKNLAIQRKAKEIKSILDAMRADQAEGAIEISITLVMDGEARTIRLDGRYSVDMASENTIKAMDGVISVAEEVKKAPVAAMAA